jgi:YD repeat-containing protein
MTSQTDANSKTVSYSYDANGQVTSQTDKNGQVTNFTFDNDGRLTKEQWMSGGTAIYTANWAYDAAGNLTSASDNNSAYAYTYNSDNVVTQVDNNGTSTGPRVVLNITRALTVGHAPPLMGKLVVTGLPFVILSSAFSILHFDFCILHLIPRAGWKPAPRGECKMRAIWKIPRAFAEFASFGEIPTISRELFGQRPPPLPDFPCPLIWRPTPIVH